MSFLWARNMTAEMRQYSLYISNKDIWGLCMLLEVLLLSE